MKKLIRFALALIVILLIAFTIFWFARPADVNFDEARSALPNAAYSRFADIDGVRIHYQEKGVRRAARVDSRVHWRQPSRGKTSSSRSRSSSA